MPEKCPKRTRLHKRRCKQWFFFEGHSLDNYFDSYDCKSTAGRKQIKPLRVSKKFKLNSDEEIKDDNLPNR